MLLNGILKGIDKGDKTFTNSKGEKIDYYLHNAKIEDIDFPSSDGLYKVVKMPKEANLVAKIDDKLSLVVDVNRYGKLIFKSELIKK